MKGKIQLINPEISMCKSGHKILIKKANKGKFTDYCGGKVTGECIARGKNSSDPKIRKRATFAANVRKWHKHAKGGTIQKMGFGDWFGRVQTLAKDKNGSPIASMTNGEILNTAINGVGDILGGIGNASQLNLLQNKQKKELENALDSARLAAQNPNLSPELKQNALNKALEASLNLSNNLGDNVWQKVGNALNTITNNIPNQSTTSDNNFNNAMANGNLSEATKIVELQVSLSPELQLKLQQQMLQNGIIPTNIDFTKKTGGVIKPSMKHKLKYINSLR